MNLIRFAGRSLLGSYFIVNGVKTIVNPTPLVAGTQPLASKIVPLAKDAAPSQVENLIPTDAKSLVRIDGALQILGGAGLITGIGRRLGATVIAVSMVPQVLGSRPGLPGTQQEKEERSKHFFHDVALLGAALVASQDTQGKPDLAWRAEQQRRHLAHAADKQKKQLTRGVEKQSKDLAKTFEGTQKKAKKQAKAVRKQVNDVLPS